MIPCLFHLVVIGYMLLLVIDDLLHLVDPIFDIARILGVDLAHSRLPTHGCHGLGYRYSFLLDQELRWNSRRQRGWLPVDGCGQRRQIHRFHRHFVLICRCWCWCSHTCTLRLFLCYHLRRASTLLPPFRTPYIPSSLTGLQPLLLLFLQLLKLLLHSSGLFLVLRDDLLTSQVMTLVFLYPVEGKEQFRMSVSMCFFQTLSHASSSS